MNGVRVIDERLFRPDEKPVMARYFRAVQLIERDGQQFTAYQRHDGTLTGEQHAVWYGVAGVYFPDRYPEEGR